MLSPSAEETVPAQNRAERGKRREEEQENNNSELLSLIMSKRAAILSIN